VDETYPVTKRARITFTGTGYRDGFRQGQVADIGGTRIDPASSRMLGSRPR